MTSYTPGGITQAGISAAVDVSAANTVTVATTSTQILAANDARIAIKLDNVGNKDIHIGVGHAASTDDNILRKGATTGYLKTEDFPSLTKVINGITVGASSDVEVFEVAVS